MQVYSINTGYKTQYNNMNGRNISFNGLKINPFLRNTFGLAPKIKKTDNFYIELSAAIGIKKTDLYNLTKNAPQIRLKFLKALTEQYNVRNFFRENNLKENFSNLIETYKLIKKPEPIHFDIISKTDTPFEYLVQIFNNAQNKESLKFVQKIENEILDGTVKSVKHIINMLTSEQKNEYIKNPMRYKSFLRLNADNDDAIKELDKLISGGKYNPKTFDIKYEVKHILRSSSIKSILGDHKDFLEENYSKEGKAFIKYVFDKYMPYRPSITEDELSSILNMYKNTNASNIKIRMLILQKFRYPVNNNNDSELKYMEQLFEKIDKDKNYTKFLNKIFKSDTNIESIKSLNEILDIVPIEKALIFHKNISKIIDGTNKNERIDALKNEIENPFFRTKRQSKLLADSIRSGYIQKESAFSKLLTTIENKINIIRYNHIKPKTQGTNNVTRTGLQNTKPKIISLAQTGETTPNIQSELRPVNLIQIPPITPKETQAVEQEFNDISKTIQPHLVQLTSHLELQRTFKESREAKKLRVQNDVNEIIKQKLGQKTLERQQESYKNGALVMRLKLLSEIFNSIKETRKLQKISGQKSNIGNRDALRLYSKISGKNRKLVNYMLKQTDSSGNRIFSIRDIIAIINETEIKISKIKSTQGKAFKSKDARAIYQAKYENILEQYGKLKRTKKVS